MTGISATLGQFVRETRVAAGLSQRQLSIHMGFGGNMRTWVSKVEGGKITPSINTLVTLAEALGTTVSKLIEGAEELAKNPREMAAPGVSSPKLKVVRTATPKDSLIRHPMAISKRMEIGRALGTLPKEMRA